MAIKREKLEKKIKGVYIGKYEDLSSEVQLKLINLWSKELPCKILAGIIILVGALLVLLKITGLTQLIIGDGSKNLMFKSIYPGIVIAIIGLLFGFICTNIIKSNTQRLTKKE
jgi:hypothetical protein